MGSEAQQESDLPHKVRSSSTAILALELRTTRSYLTGQEEALQSRCQAKSSRAPKSEAPRALEPCPAVASWSEVSKSRSPAVVLVFLIGLQIAQPRYYHGTLDPKVHDIAGKRTHWFCLWFEGMMEVGPFYARLVHEESISHIPTHSRCERRCNADGSCDWRGCSVPKHCHPARQGLGRAIYSELKRGDPKCW